MSQTLSASTLLAVPLAPLAGAVLAGIFGTTFGGNLIGRRLSHSLTILGVLVAFILSAMTNSGSIAWSCSKSDVDPKYLPTSCRK